MKILLCMFSGLMAGLGGVGSMTTQSWALILLILLNGIMGVQRSSAPTP